MSFSSSLRGVAVRLVLVAAGLCVGCGDASVSPEKQENKTTTPESSSSPETSPQGGESSGKVTTQQPTVSGEAKGEGPDPSLPQAAPSKAPEPATTATTEHSGKMIVSVEEAREGWLSLFDGETLFGWRQNDGGANWSVKEGTITADSGPIDLLCTSVPFANYELVVEFRAAAGTNSGLFLRTDAKPGDVKTKCFEVNIADTHPQGFTTGSLVGRQQTAEPIVGSGDWKTFRIVADGPKIVVELDGQQVLDYTDESETPRLSGLIGLQKNEGKIEFRKVIVRPLGTTSLFNGTDLTGWKVVPELKSEFTVEEGEIRVKNGLGFLESEQQWADFVFLGEAKSNAKELNSGFFYRAIPIEPGGNCNGYEVQIHNGFEEGDRNRPNNYGTGAIFNRVKARRVVSSDFEWCTLAFVASGPQVSVWVDGFQVIDWADERPANENPRRGLRVEAGHIAIQGHDPTTDLAFRNLRIAPLPKE